MQSATNPDLSKRIMKTEATLARCPNLYEMGHFKETLLGSLTLTVKPQPNNPPVTIFQHRETNPYHFGKKRS